MHTTRHTSCTIHVIEGNCMRMQRMQSLPQLACKAATAPHSAPPAGAHVAPTTNSQPLITDTNGGTKGLVRKIMSDFQPAQGILKQHDIEGGRADSHVHTMPAPGQALPAGTEADVVRVRAMQTGEMPSQAIRSTMMVSPFSIANTVRSGSDRGL